MDTWKTYLLTVVGVIEMVFFSGVIYGWANMVLVLKGEGYFEDLCGPDNSTSTDKTNECSKQDDRLALIFTIAVAAFNVGGFLSGVVFDKFGTRVNRLVTCSIFFLAGLFSFFLEKENANLTFAVIICLAIGGMFDAISLFQIAELHPKHRLAVSSLLSGALDSSSIVFLIFKTCYDAGASFRWILMTYTIIAIIWILINTFVFMPKASFAVELEEKSKATQNQNVELGATNPGLSTSVAQLNFAKNSSGTGDSKNPVENSEKKVNENHDDCGGQGNSPKVLEEPGKEEESDKYSTGWHYILTPRYLWLFYFLCVLQLRLWFFVGSLNTFLQYKTNKDKDTIDKYTRSFGLIQFFGCLFAPFTGIVMDMKPRSINNPYFGPVISFIITNFLCILLGVFALVPVLEVQYLSFVVQVAMRAFLYASLISFILRAFPSVHYGKLYGVCTIGAAAVSLLQYPAFIILDGPFDGNPFWVNFGFLVLSFTGFGLPLHLWISHRNLEEITTSF